MNLNLGRQALVFRRITALFNGASGPVFLFLRLSLGQAFLISGLLKVANWDTALTLAAYEYPVPWLDPVMSAYLGAAIEVLGGALLMLGLGARLAAASLLALVVVSHIYYVRIDLNILWSWLLLWVVISGAGVFSLDALLAKGIGRSPLLLMRAMSAVYAGMSHWGGLLLRPLFRCFLGLALYATVNSDVLSWSTLIRAVPIDATAWAAMTFAVLLVTGFATRALALVLAIWVGVAGIAASELTWFWSLLLLMLATNGPGSLSIDQAIRFLVARFEPEYPDSPEAREALPHVVIVGAGFGGVACAQKFQHANVRVTLIDKRNHHLFQPLLYQVATTTLTPSDIAAPIREVFRDQPNVSVLMDTVTGVNKEQQQVLLGDRALDYDYLVLATGARHSYFGRDDWAPYAPGLKRVEDATEIRRRVLTAFEQADACADADERSALMTFVVIGAGPTGVEMAGAIAELAHFGMDNDFRHIDPSQARVILVDSGDRVLAAFNPDLSAKAEAALLGLGAEVVHNKRATDINADGVHLGEEFLPARTVMWAAGVVASPAAQWLDAESDRAGRVVVDEQLNIAGLSNVFGIGDTALAMAWEGKPVPGLAPAAKQTGEYAAQRILAELGLARMPAAFAYKHLGSLATIGRKAAVADFDHIRLSGPLAWWLWGAVHVMFLVGFRSRFSVMLDWAWGYFTYRTGTRLITDVNTGAD